MPAPKRSWEREIRRHKLVFQPLEPRVLLSSQMAVPDGDGDMFEVKVTGPGSAVVVLGDVNGDGKNDIQSITLHDTTEKSALTVTLKKKAVAGDGELAIGSVLSDGTGAKESLGSFTALKSDLVGAGINLDGTILKVVLDDLRNGADIKLPGAPLLAKTTLSLVLGDVGAGSEILVKAGVSSITVASAGAGTWSAATFGAVIVKAGGLAAAINTTATAALLGKTLAIGKVSVTGGNFTGSIEASGNIGPISVVAVKTVGGAITGATITGGSLASISAAAMSADIALTGPLGAVTVKGNASGNWSALTFGAVTVTGGNLSADLTATGTSAVLAKKPVISAITVTGGNFVGDILATLDVGTISVSKTKTVGGFAAGSWSAATFKSISVKGGNLDATVLSTRDAVALGKLLAIGKITVTGGNFTGDVSAAGTLGPVTVANDKLVGGNITGATLTAGNLGIVSATGAVQQSIILAGGNLGSDHAPGGTGFASDTFLPGKIAGFSAGSVSASVVGAGLFSSDGILGNDDDDVLGFGGSLVKSFLVKGTASADSFFASRSFPNPVKINGAPVVPSGDPRFLTTGSPDRRSPILTAALASDTGVSARDGITSVATISGMATDNQTGLQLTAALGAGGFSPVTIGTGGAFTLTKTQLEAIKGGTLVDGSYVLHLRAKDTANNTRNFDVTFTLDTTAPSQPTLDLSPTSDTGATGDQLTSASIVTLTGAAEPNARLTIGTAVSQASALGSFSFPNVTLVDGSNMFAVSTMDVAGNATVKMVDITRNGTLASGDVVLEWNAVNLEAVRLDATPPPVATRGMAMVSAAIYDVVNAFEGTPGLMVSRPAPAGASVEAAIAGAAHKLLGHLFPGQQALFDASLVTTLARVPDGAAETDGRAFGEVIAQVIIDLRAGDGFDQYVDYTPGGKVGDWRETGPMFAPALLPNWATLTPFVMTSSGQLRPDGPPSLDSQKYADDFNKTKALGAATGSTRTAEQTQIARFWGDGGGTYTPPGHWDQIAAQIGQQRGNSVSANARLLAELNLAMADASIVAWDAKYHFNAWRPVTAIQGAELDGNDQTTADAAWQSFLITPAFPEYVSGHSTYSGAAAAVLTAVFGDNVAFSTTSLGLPGVTRNFTSFQEAANEAGESRIYGGIHFEFANQDGLAAGRALGTIVHDRFQVAGDVNAPQVFVDAPPFGVVSSTNFNVQGRAFDNLSGLATFTAQLDSGAATAVTVDASNHFSIPLNLAGDGSADGAHTLHLRAIDSAGNVAPVDFPFTFDTRAPLLAINGLGTGTNAVDYTTHLSGTADATGSMLTALNYQIGTGSVMPLTFDPATGKFDEPLDLSPLTAGSYDVKISATDAAGLTTTLTRNITLAAAIPFTITHATPAADSSDVGTTFRPQIFFSRPVNGASLNGNNFYATDSAGVKIPATVVPANDGTFAWLFFTNPMPAGATITVHVEGSTIMSKGAAPLALDGDFDGVAGGNFTYNFTTVSLVKVAGTSLSGIVLDPGADLKPMTFDDMRAGPDGILHTADDLYLNRLEHVKVFIVGLESEAVFTDSMGRFSFASTPVGDVKLAIDGRTATNAPTGFYFPEMVMDLTLLPGHANTSMDSMGSAAEKIANAGRPEVYLPRLQSSILQPVSTTGMTMVGVDAASAPNLTPQQRGELTLEVQPGSLIGMNGQPMSSGMVGISTVPPELVRDMLPPGLLQHTFDITIQAPGVATFAEPLQITFPNVFNSPPGTKLNFLSFDHTTGKLVIEGTATVSADGLSATTDPGFGITKPGWHGVTPPGNCGGAGGPPPPPPPKPAAQDSKVTHPTTVFPLLIGENGAFPKLSWTAPAKLPNTPPPPPPPPGCAIPPRPPEGQKQQPYINVTITVDGPLAKFMEKSGQLDLVSQAFTLSAGQGATKTFAAVAKGYVQMYGPDGIKKPLDNELYGSRVKITEIRGNPDGSRSYDYYTYDLFRFVNATDDTPNDGKIEFEKTLADGLGGADRDKFILVKGGGQSRPTVELATGGDAYSVAGGGGAYLVNFDPAVENAHAGILTVKTPDGTVVPGPINLVGNGEVKQHIFVDKGSLVATLKQMAEDNAPQTLTFVRSNDIGSIKLTYNGHTTAAIAVNATAAQVQAALLALPDFKPGDIGVSLKTSVAAYFVSGNSGPTVNYAKTEYRITFGGTLANVQTLAFTPEGVTPAVNGVISGNLTADNGGGITADEKKYFDNLENDLITKKPTERAELATAVADAIIAHFSGFAAGIDSGTGADTMRVKFRTIDSSLLGDSSPAGGIDNEAATGTLITNRAKYNAVVQNFLLDDALNRVTQGTVEAYPDTPLEGHASVTRDEFIRTVAKSASHEIGHTLGLTHTYKNGKHIILNGVMGVTDVMASGEDLTEVLDFRAGMTKEQILMALNLGYSRGQGQTALGEKIEYYRIGAFDTANGSDENENEVTPILGPRLALFNADAGMLAGDTETFGNTIVDGAGGAKTVVNYVITNFGKDPLVIKNARVEGNGFSGTTITNATIAPGQILPVTVTFDPLAVGAANGRIVINSNDDSAQTQFNLAGFGKGTTAHLTLTNLNNNVGGVGVTDGAVTNGAIFTLRNDGATPLVISTLRLADGTDAFSLLGLPANFATTPITLNFGETFTLGASFDPARLGLQSGTIEIGSNDAATPLFRANTVGTGLDQIIYPQWGNDFIGIETPDLGGGVDLRVKSNVSGNFDAFLPSQAFYHEVIFDPITGLVGHVYGNTPASGTGVDLTADLVFGASVAPDSDFDGLPDDTEFAIGTSVRKADTDGDGIRDFAEIQQNLDPLSGISVPVGIVGSAQLIGEAQEVVVDLAADGKQTAYLATGTHGLAIVNTTKLQAPVVLGQLDLNGENNDVAIDARRGIAAVAGGSAGLHLVNVSDPTKPKLIQTIPLIDGATRVEAFDGVAYVATGASIAAIDISTGDELQRISVGSGNITDIALEGSMLYTLDASHNLRVVEIGADGLALRGTLTIANANGRLFVGNGIAYISADRGFQSGFVTADVSNPTAPTLISDVDDASISAHAIVANGSGLGLAVGTPANSTLHALNVVNVANPANTGVFLTRVLLPAKPNSLTLSSGIAFVADGTAGLQIVNYRAFDDLGVAPTVTVSSTVADADPNTAGIQVIEGSSIPLRIVVGDDVQVRQVDVLVNGNVVASDASFPFDLSIAAPARTAGTPNALIQVRATDSGGNSSLSNMLSYGLVDDAFPPIVLSVAPPNNSQVFYTPSVNVRFNEPLDLTRLDPAGVHLIELGADGLVGGGDDTVLTVRLETRRGDRELAIFPNVPLETGHYKLTVDAGIIVDRGGNALATPVTSDFIVKSASQIRALSGTPTILRAPSANTGQEIGFKVEWGPSVTRVKFPTIDSNGTAGTQVVAPSRVDLATGTAYFIVPPGANTGDITIYGTAANNFTGFVNWNVTDGTVDLLGTDAGGQAFNDLKPGNGLYVDLDGSTFGNAGKLESKTDFVLAPGTYELTFDLAGSQGSDVNAVTVSLGTAFSEAITRAATAPFSTETRTITVTSATSGKIIFDQAGGDTRGALLRKVKLTNTTTGKVLLDDNFDLLSAESPLPLQIVPTLADVDSFINGTGFHTGTLRLRGTGFIEGGVTINFGDTHVVDTNPFAGPDVFPGYVQENDGLNVVVPAGAPYGAISVTTAGGTSTVFVATLTGVTSVAGSGTPANAAVASANPGQAITLTGTGFGPNTGVIFPTIDGNGTRGERAVRPTAFKADGTELTVLVPLDVAVTGSVGIVGDRNNSPLPLQIIPVLDSVDFNYLDANNANVRLRGAGFVEGNNSTYHFGSVDVVDVDAGTGPNAGGFYLRDNDGVDLQVPVAGGNYFGPVTVTTLGGTSAAFSVGVTNVSGVAFSGTPADAGRPSANPGQAVTITGTGLSTGTDIVATYIDSNGTPQSVLLNPGFVNTAQTSATVTLPGAFNGISTLHFVGSTATATVQIVPQLFAIDLNGQNTSHWVGLGFVEGNTTFAISGASVIDTSAGGGPNIYASGGPDNNVADLTLGNFGPGTASVTTAGGTSAPLPWKTVNTGLGASLFGTAFDAATGEFLVATSTEVKRINPATGALVASFALPGGNSGNIGLQILPTAMTLNGVSVPAGSLLVTNGVPNPDAVYAVNAQTGVLIASLSVGENIDSVGGLYDAASGHLFLLDENPNDVVEINPTTGAVLNRYAVPFDVYYGGIALNPANGHLFIGSSQTTLVVEMTTSGTVVKYYNLASQGLHGGELSGLAFDASGHLLVSSINRGTISRFDLVGLAGITQASITGITSVAGGGTPAGAGASANASQVIEITGTNFGLNTQVIFPVRDSNGTVYQVAAVPLTVNAAGTRLQVQVPALAQTGGVMVNNIGNQRDLGYTGFTDGVYRTAGFNFTAGAGTNSAIRFNDGGIQDKGDESWGIDNVRVVRVSDSQVIYSTDFEGGADNKWSDRTTDNADPGGFTQFLGRFANGGSTLNLTNTVAGVNYRVEFDFYALDSWDGNNGPDFFNVFANGQSRFHETFSNYSAAAVQTYGAAAGGNVNLQIVPLLTRVGGRPGGDDAFALFGSGFMEGGSTIKVGGVTITDSSTTASGGDVYGASNDTYGDLGAALAVEGPIRITTAGGYFEITGLTDAVPAFVELSGISANAAVAGIPVDPALPSANTGQQITLIGRGFDANTLVQFDAADDTGATGVVTRTGTASSNGTRLTVTVPALARTGSVRVVGSATVLPLQVVPVLRGFGGTLTPGQTIVLEGTGLRTGGLTVSIDGQSAVVTGGRIVSDRGPLDQEVAYVTVPAGISAGILTVTTAGGSSTFRAFTTITSQPDLTPAGDVGDTLATALAVNVPLNSRVAVTSQTISGASTSLDVDLYSFTGNVGDIVTIDVVRGTGYQVARIFDAAGLQLAIDSNITGPNSGARIPFFRLPGTGTYFVGVSGYGDTNYDPTVANTGTASSYPGTYQLKLQRQDGSSSSFSGIVANAVSGIAATSGVASANTAQTITINGSGFVTGDRVFFSTQDSQGNLSSAAVTPTTIAVDGLSLTVVVPVNATTGIVRLERENAGLFLQIVPTLVDVDQALNGAQFRGGTLRLRGTGFVEGSTTIRLGTTTLTDTSPTSGPDVFGGYVNENDGLNVIVPSDAQFGPISVTTLGGTSAVFDSTFTNLASTAASGTPANPAIASANPGQAITLTGTGFNLTTDVVFQTIDGNGTRGDRVVRPVAVRPDGTELTVVVPLDVAVTGTVGIVGDRNNSAIPLQIVPLLQSVDFTSVNTETASVRLRGAGFVEANGSTYRFGNVELTDDSVNAGPNAGGFYVRDNDGVDLSIPVGAGNYHGAVTVTTAGGTSAPFSVGFTAISGVAATGTPANAGTTSANPGQAITLTGTGLSTSTDIIAQYLDGNGTLQSVLLNPAFANLAGTSATLVVPTYMNGAYSLHVAGSAFAPILQIVPTLTYANFSGGNSVRLRGYGFAEGTATSPVTYTIGNTTVVDTNPGTGVNVGGFFVTDNDGADVPFTTSGSGQVTIQTAGGTSAPVIWNVINPTLGALYDVAFGGGNLYVATTSEVKRIDAATGATLSSFAMPGGNTGNVGLQILPSAMTLNGVSVPAGSLLVTNGAPDPDAVIAVDPTNGTVIASLSIVEAVNENIDAVGGLYDAASGHLFVLDYQRDKLLEVDPANGAVLNRFTIPFDVYYGGIALDPVSGHLFIATSQSTSLVEMTTAGVVLRQYDLSQQGIGGELSGLAFNGAGQLFASSTRGVIFKVALTPFAAISQATITGITSVAAAGTPANGGQSSANAGQLIEITGTNFGPNTQVIFPARDTAGNVFQIAGTALFLSPDGTRIQVQVPAFAQTGGVMVTNIGNQRDLGFSSHTDAIYRTATVNFTGSGTTSAIRFADGGIQDRSDESWGIDNVRVVKTSDNSVVYSTTFEGGAGAEWTDRTTDSSYLGSFTQFLGRFASSGSTLNLTNTVAGENYRVEFDFYALDSWDGNVGSPGPDTFNVFVNGQRKLHETFSNYSAANVQTFRAAEGGTVPLQIVPVLTGIGGRAGRDDAFSLSGSGFMEGASTITVGGVSLVDSSTGSTAGDVVGNNDQYNDLALPLTVEGPVRITTAGGYFEIQGPLNTAPAFVEFTSIVASAASGNVASPAQASANSGQQIKLIGRGFDTGTIVQFDAIGDAGVAGFVTRTGTVNAAGTELTVTVPALARTGNVRVVGSATVVPLQVVPFLRSIGGTLAAGNTIVLEGTGLRTGDLSVSIDGQPATITGGRIVSDRGTFDQEVAYVTVPAGTTVGAITVTTAGGSSIFRPGTAIAPLSDLAPGSDVGDRIADAVAVTLPLNSKVTISQTVGDGAFGQKDVDLYSFTGNGGDIVTIDFVRGTNLFAYVRLFDAAGVQLAIDGFSGAGSNPRIPFFHLPANGTYFVGVSGYANASYDPAVENSGNTAGYIGTYQLKLQRQDGGSSSILGISATATSGTATTSGVASANPGQTITLNGTGLLTGDRVVFLTQDSGGSLNSVTVNAASIATDGNSLTVIVPGNAATGTVRLERESVGLFLQVVPTLVDVDQAIFGTQFHGQNLRLRGTGFVEGGSTISFGGTQVIDTSASNGPDIFGGYVQENDAMNIVIPSDAATGAISVTTFGGTSAVFNLTFTGFAVGTVAATGTPANPALASANPGQTITINGTGFDTSTDVVFPAIDGNGTTQERVVRPATVNAGGTQLTVVVPLDVAFTGNVGIVGEKTGASIPLQIVPVLDSADFNYTPGDGSYANVRLRGKGFVEANGTIYRFGQVEVTDETASQGPNAGGFYLYDNDGADLSVPLTSGLYNGPITVTTAGGTSAPFTVGFTGITSTATTGSAASGASASANPGQTITLNGTGFTTATDIFGQFIDGNGTLSTQLFTPATAAADGTSATFVVPNYFNGAFLLRIAGASNSFLLQIVPVVLTGGVTSNGAGVTRWHGLGFVEGNGTVWTLNGVSVTDTSTSGSPINVGGYYAFDNDGADVNLGLPATGSATVTTAGGTSAPVPV